MKNRFNILLGLFIISICTLPGVLADSPRSAELCTITITDAYYIENDIYVYVSVFLDSGSGTERYYLTVDLENPSGEVSSVTIKVNTILDLMHFEIVYYNHATVTGDYKVCACVVYNTFGWNTISDVMVFDPPGSNEGDPWIGVTVL